MFEKLPTSNQEHFLQAAPQIIAEAATKAVRTGHAAAAKEMLVEAATHPPTGATVEQWRAILAGGLAAVSTA
jgi:hypothetical protein